MPSRYLGIKKVNSFAKKEKNDKRDFVGFIRNVNKIDSSSRFKALEYYD